jgi:tRNA-specific 2-thiouridylase
LNWIAGTKPGKKDLKVKIRHGIHQYDCKIAWIDEATLTAKLAKSDKGIAPGQFAVFYDEDICLGGGVILQDSD